MCWAKRHVIATAMITVFLSGNSDGGEPMPRSPSKSPHGASLPRRERCEGFSFEIPVGWSRMAPQKPGTKAMLVIGGYAANGIILVDKLHPLSLRAEQTLTKVPLEPFG